MSTGIIEEGLVLDYIDIEKLVEAMAQRLEGQGIRISRFVPLTPRWHQKFLAGYGGRMTGGIGRTINNIGEYELIHVVDSYVSDREKKLGKLRVEKGLVDKAEADYERVTLNTFRGVRPRGRDVIIPPTRLDICILGFDEGHATGYDMVRRDKHPQLNGLLPTELFLRPDALEYLKENKKLI